MKRRMIMAVMVFLTMAGIVISGCARETVDNSWPRIERTKKVVIGLDDTFVPMGFRQKNGQLAGYDIDLAKAVFKRYGIKADFQTIDWSMKETELKNQTIDLIWNGKELSAPTKNTYPIIPTGNFVTTYSEEKGWFTYLERVEIVQKYSPICIETQTDKYKVLKLEFIDTFSIKWTRNYDLNQSGEEDLIRSNN